MAGFANLRAVVDAVDAGKLVQTAYRKSPVVITAAGYWLDLSMAPGNPKPNYYSDTPLRSVQLAQSTDGGIFHGGAVAPSSKHLLTLSAMTATAGATPLPMILCDYLLFYPAIEESMNVDEPMSLVNTVGLPRSTSGVGVQIMPVVVAGHVGSPTTTFNVTYTNSDGTPGRTSQTVNINPTQFVNGTILTTSPTVVNCVGPFIPLQQGDVGVRSIQAVTINSGGDVGLFTLVLIKPVAHLSLRGIDAPVEVNYITDRTRLPVIEDDAYLNFLCMPAGNVSGATILGDAQFVWS